MTILTLVKNDIPALTKPCLDYDFEDKSLDPSQIAHDLVDTMNEHNGLGLAANQVGLPYRIFVMRGDPLAYACFNPKIVMFGKEEIILEESCLSFPGLIVKIKRPRHLRMRFQGPDGEVRTHEFTGMTARIVQHEMDHLNGKLFYNNASRYHRDQAMRKWKR